MALAPLARVLELGCGPGFIGPFVAEAVPRGIVVLADLQFEMLACARERLCARSKARYLQSDASLLPLRAGCFDAVLLATMLGEVPNRDAWGKEIHRVLAPGGIVTVVETRRDSDFIAFPKLYELFCCHAFVFVDRRRRRWRYAARFRAI
jgi:ubiquinone/menaquinone biosynthesis C-methylase UbiE